MEKAGRFLRRPAHQAKNVTTGSNQKQDVALSLTDLGPAMAGVEFASNDRIEVPATVRKRPVRKRPFIILGIVIVCLLAGALYFLQEGPGKEGGMTVRATDITATSATIVWASDQPLSSQVEYGTTPAYGSLSAFSAAPVKSHSVTLTALTPGTTYNYAALSTNPAGQVSTSANFTFTTPGGGATAANVGGAAVINGVKISGITTNSATITWTTDQPSASQVEYGTTTAYGSLSAFSTAPVTSHTVALTALSPGTTYNFAALSTSSAGQTSSSANLTFTTTGTTGAPVITGVTVSGITSNSATIAWTTDQPVTSQVEYGVTKAYGSLSVFSAATVTSHSVKLTALMPGTTYNYAALSASSAGQSTASANFTFSTPVLGPPVISDATAGSISSNSATITWTTDQPSAAQVEYGTTPAHGLLSAFSAAPATSHSVTLMGLKPGVTYDYTALSANAVGLVGKSANLTFTTGEVGASTAIGRVTAGNMTPNSATITWTTDAPSTSQVEFGTTPAHGLLSAFSSQLATSHSVVVNGLTPGTTYNYAALSTNAGGQIAKSANFTFTTTASPPVISAVTAVEITATSVKITWTTDQPSTSQVKYGATTAFWSLLHRRRRYDSVSDTTSSLATTHSVVLNGLTPNTTYNCMALSANSTGIENLSPNVTFTTH